jgi:hypothetical protein
VKKAVKTAAAKKPAPKKTTTTAKKAAPKKKAATKTAARRTAKKPAAKKAAPKRPRVKLTPEEKQKAKIRDLRVKALKEPVTHRALSTLNAFIAETTSGKGTGRAKVGDAQKAFKNLSPAELEHYNHIASEKNAARRAEYEAWIKTYTPDQIRIANNARAQLRKLLADTYKTKPAHTDKLLDDRAVKRPTSIFATFVKERHASGDFKNINLQDAMKLIANEWKALSAGEKQKYQDGYVAQRDTAAAA